ncbi:MAG: ArsA family ATPase [Clostridia bacterium]|nr:ArsA family ATPase [Deltaproteobacteria bacterium]
MTQSLVEHIADRSVVLCVGSGGVGKTTTSAALALAAAETGRKVVVLTIDPARRLADALGVGVDNEPRRVPLAGRGELSAVMLDPATTFDDLIRRLSPTPARADSLLNNVVYKQISRALAGTLEYTAIEKLYDLRERGGFDLVVVDTPPSKNVLDFIEAPEWLSRFLDERILKWFAVLEGPGDGGVKQFVMKRTARVVSDILGKIFGGDFVGDLSAFVRDIECMAAELRHRAENVQALLASKNAGFVVVTTPEPQVITDAVFLRNALQKHTLDFLGFVVNRTSEPSGLVSPELSARAASDSGHVTRQLAKKLAAAALSMDARVRDETANIAKLRRDARWDGYIGLVPREAAEIHDIDGLRALERYL